MNHFAIIGAGQIGSRHLQALALYHEESHVWVVDPSPDSLSVARQRFAQVEGNSLVHGHFISSLRGIPSEVDFAVVTTSANVRRQATEDLLARARVRYLVLEKVLFQKQEDYAALAALIGQRAIPTYVNCPRRMGNFFQSIKSEMEGGPVTMFNSGSDWGLACNAVHFADLLAFLSGVVPHTCLESGLTSGTIPSRRPGFEEFTGSLMVEAGPARAVLVSRPEPGEPVLLSIMGTQSRYVIDEGSGRYVTARASNAWRWEEGRFEVLLQSKLTHIVAESLLRTGRCDLTPYSESARIHQPLLAAFLRHMGRPENGTCPIT